MEGLGGADGNAAPKSERLRRLNLASEVIQRQIESNRNPTHCLDGAFAPPRLDLGEIGRRNTRFLGQNLGRHAAMLAPDPDGIGTVERGVPHVGWNKLLGAGFNPGPIDGDFGSRTAADSVIEKARASPFDSAVDPGFTAALFAGVAAKEPAWLTETRKDLGVNGGVGAGDIPDVVKMFAEAGHPEIKRDAVAWWRGPSMPGCSVPASRVQTGIFTGTSFDLSERLVQSMCRVRNHAFVLDFACATCSQKISSTSKSRCP